MQLYTVEPPPCRPNQSRPARFAWYSFIMTKGRQSRRRPGPAEDLPGTLPEYPGGGPELQRVFYSVSERFRHPSGKASRRSGDGWPDPLARLASNRSRKKRRPGGFRGRSASQTTGAGAVPDLPGLARLPGNRPGPACHPGPEGVPDNVKSCGYTLPSIYNPPPYIPPSHV